LCFFDGNQAINDRAALHQKPVHFCIDPVNIAPEIGEGDGGLCISHQLIPV
jgi:hypothetical protein